MNNQKSNLRVCTAAQNQYNKRKPVGFSSPYKGVSWSKRHQSWQAQIRKDSKKYRLGYFKNEQAAARAYDLRAKELFGEFARCNL